MLETGADALVRYESRQDDHDIETLRDPFEVGLSVRF